MEVPREVQGTGEATFLSDAHKARYLRNSLHGQNRVDGNRQSINQFVLRFVSLAWIVDSAKA